VERYLYVEKVYIILSLVSKTILVVKENIQPPWKAAVCLEFLFYFFEFLKIVPIENTESRIINPQLASIKANAAVLIIPHLPRFSACYLELYKSI
jgi:hypothetical protein